MKRKIALMFMLILSFSFALTGCSLFETNYDKYYNTTVVTIEYPNGENIKINKKQLINAFNSYGASLVQNYGMSIEEALNRTITSLINQQILIKESKNQIQLTNKDYNQVWQESYNSLMENLESFANEVREIWGIKLPEEKPEEENKNVYKPYEKTAQLSYENGKWVIRVIKEKNEDENQPLKYNATDYEGIIRELRDKVLEKTVFKSDNQNLTEQEQIAKQNAKLYQEAYKKYLKVLTNNEKGMRLSTDEESIFLREVKRIYDNRMDSIRVSKMQEKIYFDTTLSDVTVEDVLEKYKGMLLESYTKYKVNPDSLSEDLLSNFGSVNYTDSDDFFFVSHILLKFDDTIKDKEGRTQKQRYQDLESDREKGLISLEKYNKELSGIINEIKVIERDLTTGKEVESNYNNVEKLLADIKNALKNAYLISDETERKQEINKIYKEFLYRFNQDEGALNSEYLYVIGKNDSKMVEPFTKAARELYNNGNGTYGSISNLVASEHGVHIIFYAGKVKDSFPIKVYNADHLSLKNEDIKLLDETLLNPLNNKTLFDKIYSSITASESSANEVMYLNVLKKDLKITKHVSAYKDLLGK